MLYVDEKNLFFNKKKIHSKAEFYIFLRVKCIILRINFFLECNKLPIPF
jgi:hypothetical protein